MKVRTHLALMAAAILLPMVLLSAVALGVLLNAERESARRGVLETTRLISLAVDQELIAAQSALRVLANSAYLAAGDIAGFYQQALRGRTKQASWIILYDGTGRQLLNTLYPYGTALPASGEPARVTEVIRTTRTTFSNLFTGPALKRLVISIDEPVETPDGRQYVISQVFYPGYFDRSYSALGLPGDWIVGIFDRNHLIISRSHRPADFVGKPGAPVVREALKTSPEGVTRHPSREGIDVYDVYTRSPLSGWAVAIGVPIESLEGAARRAVLVAAVGALGALGIATAIAFLIGRRLNASIAQAAASAIALGRGQTPPVHLSGVDEIDGVHGALAEAGLNLASEKDARSQVEAERAELLARELAARQAAEAQNRAKDEFLAMLGHELRNPLSAISGASSVLEGRTTDSRAFAQACEVIKRQTRHLSHVVDDLLDLSRVMTGKIALELRPIELGQAARHCLATVRAATPDDHHDVTIGGEPVWVSADATRLDQVITNLLTNAFKYTAADGRIEIETGTDGADAVLTVRDHGIGISPRLLPQIFEVFVQGEASIDRARGGLGIGLALVRQLVLLHGGTVVAASEGPGKGSLFTVRIPRAEAPAEEPSAPVAAGPVAQERRVLLVDDHDDSRQMLSLLLRLSGYQAIEARDGNEGLRLALEAKPDVAVIDIGLPGLDGYEVARRLRADAATRLLPLIALTGYGQDEDRRLALAAGFDLHLVKPVDGAKFIEIVANCAHKQDTQGG